MTTDEDFRRKPDPKEQIRLAQAGLIKDKRHKYGVAPTPERTLDGIVFDSKKEATHYAALKRLEAAGVITELELQPEFCWEQICRNPETGVEVVSRVRYRADFSYLLDGERHYIDVKGHRTRTYRRKKRIVEALFGVEIEEV